MKLSRGEVLYSFLVLFVLCVLLHTLKHFKAGFTRNSEIGPF